MRMKLVRPALLLLLPLLLCGCVDVTETDSSTVYTYQWWVSPVTIAAGLAISAVAWHTRKSGARSVIFLVVAVVGTVGFAPFAWFDRVEIGNGRLTTRWGFWIFPSRYEITLSDVNRVDYVRKDSRGRRGGRQTSYYLQFHLRQGTMEELSTGNALMDAAAEEVVASLQAAGVPFTDRTHE